MLGKNKKTDSRGEKDLREEEEEKVVVQIVIIIERDLSIKKECSIRFLVCSINRKRR